MHAQVRYLGQNPTDEEVEQMKNDADKDKLGTVDFSKFVQPPQPTGLALEGRRKVCTRAPVWEEDFTIWKNNTSPEARILSPARTPSNASTLREASLFAHFWVDPKSKIILPTLPNRHKYHVFFEVA